MAAAAITRQHDCNAADYGRYCVPDARQLSQHTAATQSRRHNHARACEQRSQPQVGTITLRSDSRCGGVKRRGSRVLSARLRSAAARHCCRRAGSGNKRCVSEPIISTDSTVEARRVVFGQRRLQSTAQAHAAAVGRQQGRAGTLQHGFVPGCRLLSFAQKNRGKGVMYASPPSRICSSSWELSAMTNAQSRTK